MRMGPAPGKGTCTSRTPAAAWNMTRARCSSVPTPVEPKLIVSGARRARAIRSAKSLIGEAAGTLKAEGSETRFATYPKSSSVNCGARRSIGRLTRPVEGPVRHAEHDAGVLKTVGGAMKDRSYLLLHAGFFTCGFHIAFLVTHLPGEVNLCGLPPSVASWSLAIIGLANIFGSLYAGSCISRYRSKYVLAAMYGSRAVLIGLYLLLPRTELNFYLFAAGLGFTWLATVPPTAAIVGKLFGIRYLATLFGLTLLSHQIGGFLGAYVGGVVIVRFGDFGWMWYADMALAAAAALINLPIREAPVARALAPA